MKKLLISILGLSLVIITISCNLNETVLDTPTGKNALNSSTVNKSALAPVYASYRDLYGRLNEMLNLEDIASEEQFVPFRGGTDWFNGGIFFRLHKHTWTASGSIMKLVWGNLTKAIAKSAYAQKVISNHMNKPDAKQLLAEARAMGAFWNQVMLDNWGVAFEKDPSDIGKHGEGTISKVYRGKDAVNYILQQYNKAEVNLGTYSSVGTTHFTKAAVWAFKARLFLNKPIYVDEYADHFDFTKSDMDSVIYYATKVIKTGDYHLATGGRSYFNIFSINNDKNRSIIFAFHQSIENEGSNRLAYFPMSRAMHGSLIHISAQGTDGNALTPEAYHMWDGHHNDPRFFLQNLPQGPGCISPEDYTHDRGIQVGQQYGIVVNSSGSGYKKCENGELKIEKLIDHARTGEPVDYTVKVGLTKNNGQSQGARPFKYQYDPESHTHEPSRVDLAMMRYADAYFMRAEAELREGNTASAIKDVNKVRTTVGAKPAKSMNLKRMEKEWIWEFYYEWRRRRQQIRFGDYISGTWTGKTKHGDVTRRLYAIPQAVIDASQGHLHQNKGY
jgi:hypothetical protein